MDFNDRCHHPLPADAHKRVLYSHGLVLGVGEFRTEQNYFLEKHRSHNRALHGYGTVSGLAVSVRDTPEGPEVRVSPGLAIDPRGREICVPEPQCARLNEWLLTRETDQGSPPDSASPPASVTAYVVLCYRQCETDKVPVPVGPCQPLDKSVHPSRVQDAFELRLVETPPPQVSLMAMGQLGQILARVRVADEPGALTQPDMLLEELRALVPDGSPPASAGSPPAEWVLHPDAAGAIMRAVLRTFVTEVRPLLEPDGGACLRGQEDCVLLAQVVMTTEDVGGTPVVAAGGVTIEEDARPFLLPSQLLQSLGLGQGSDSLGALAPLALSLSLSEGAERSSAPAPLRISLPPSLGSPLNTRASAGTFAGTTPALRFRRNGSVVFSFSPPEPPPEGSAMRLRLHWSHDTELEALQRFRWQTQLRAFRPRDNLGEAPEARLDVNLRAEARPTQRRRLVVSESNDLSFALGSQDPFITLTLTLDSPPEAPDTFLLLAEVVFVARGR